MIARERGANAGCSGKAELLVLFISISKFFWADPTIRITNRSPPTNADNPSLLVRISNWHQINPSFSITFGIPCPLAVSLSGWKLKVTSNVRSQTLPRALSRNNLITAGSDTKTRRRRRQSSSAYSVLYSHFNHCVIEPCPSTSLTSATLPLIRVKFGGTCPISTS